jgi:hypothetical protein
VWSLSILIEVAVPDAARESVPTALGEPENPARGIHAVAHPDELTGQAGYLDAVAVCHAARALPPILNSIASRRELHILIIEKSH